MPPCKRITIPLDSKFGLLTVKEYLGFYRKGRTKQP